MKIRIQGNSIRIRLSRTEVEKLSESGRVTEQTIFGDSIFSYTVERHPAVNQLSATYVNGKITVFIPAEFTRDWPVNDIIGLEASMPVGASGSLHILIEKDFKCLDRPTEDQSDQYENPKESC